MKICLFLWANLAAGALLLPSCSSQHTLASDTKSGPGTDPAQLGCEGLQSSFVDDGLKFDESATKLRALPGVTVPGSSQPAAESGRLDQWRTVKKSQPFTGSLAPLLSETKLPESVSNEADCRAWAGADSTKYDLCTDLVIFRKRLSATADTWDNNGNAKKCYEGRAFEVIRNPEFAYCDNQCGFNDEACSICDFSYNGGQQDRFVCKTLSSTRDAIGAFCRTTGVNCAAYDPATACRSAKGKDLAGPGGIVLGGSSEETVEAALTGYIGASESVNVKAGVVAGQQLAARGTATGTVGYRRKQGAGSLFTPSGIGVNGLTVECYLSVSGVASITYDYQAGVGADFVFASGEATVNAGGGFSLTKAYTKTSPTFSGAGMSKDAIFKQCINNYVMSWVGVEMENWVNEYSGLRLLKRAIGEMISGLGLDPQYVIGSRGLFCLYPQYDGGNGWETGEVRVYPESDAVRLIWTHHLSFWPDRESLKVEANDDAIRPFLRDLKDGTLAGDRLTQFFNQVVAPASKAESRGEWHMDYCWR